MEGFGEHFWQRPEGILLMILLAAAIIGAGLAVANQVRDTRRSKRHSKLS